MKSLFAWIFAASSLGLAGCLTVNGCLETTPDITAHQAINAASKRDLKTFREALTPDAQATLGTEESMTSFAQEIGRYTNIAIGPALLVSAEQGDQGYGHTGDVRRQYETIVAGSPQEGAPLRKIYTVFLQCNDQYATNHVEETAPSCVTMPDPSGDLSQPWITSCYGGSPGYDSLDLIEWCAVDRIQK
jgi:hypothetical protein